MSKITKHLYKVSDLVELQDHSRYVIVKKLTTSLSPVDPFTPWYEGRLDSHLPLKCKFSQASILRKINKATVPRKKPAVETTREGLIPLAKRRRKPVDDIASYQFPVVQWTKNCTSSDEAVYRVQARRLFEGIVNQLPSGISDRLFFYLLDFAVKSDVGLLPPSVKSDLGLWLEQLQNEEKL